MSQTTGFETIRTEADIDKILKFAKLERSEFLPTVQCVSFETSLDNECVQLVEIDPVILGDLESGKTLHLRGHKGDSATLCTAGTTYDVKIKETSNTLLLVPDLVLPESGKLSEPESDSIIYPEIKAMQHVYFEVRKTLPHLKRLTHLLEENAYNGREYEEDEHHQGKKYTFNELLEEIQASEDEIKTALVKANACEIGSHWRMLSFDFIVRVVEDILKLVDDQSWTIDAVPFEECCNILQDLFPRQVVAHLLKSFSKPLLENDQEGEYQLDEDKICRMYAEIILKASERFHLDNFLSVWQESVPSGMTTSLYQLEGLGLVDRDSTPPIFRYFPVSNLPEDAALRFEELFKAKTKWTLEEITPYITDIATEKMSVGSLLMRNARASTENGIKMFSSKKPAM